MRTSGCGAARSCVTAKISPRSQLPRANNFAQGLIASGPFAAIVADLVRPGRWVAQRGPRAGGFRRAKKSEKKTNNPLQGQVFNALARFGPFSQGRPATCSKSPRAGPFALLPPSWPTRSP